jgi:tetratricopeptide (TPR) repeat protein
VTSPRSSLPLLGLLCLLLGAGIGGPAYLWWKGPERRLIDANQRHDALWNWLPPLEEFKGYCRESEEATDQALRRRALRDQARGSRVRLFALTLQPERMRQEADLYLSERKGVSNKDFVLAVPLVLYDMESTPSPDSSEMRRLQPLRIAAENYLGKPPDIDWYRPELLNRFVGVKKTFVPGDPTSRSAADAELTEILRYAPEFAAAHYLRGRARLDLGETETALADFRRAVELNSGLTTAHRWAADALERLGRREEAIAESSRALSKDPQYIEVREFKERLDRR